MRYSLRYQDRITKKHFIGDKQWAVFHEAKLELNLKENQKRQVSGASLLTLGRGGP